MLQESPESSRLQLHSAANLIETLAAAPTPLDVNTLLSHLAAILTKTMSMTSAFVLDWEPESENTSILVAFNGQVVEHDKFSNTSAIIQKRVKEGRREKSNLVPPQVMILQANDPDLSEMERQYFEQHSGKTLLILPLVNEDQLFGFVELWENRRYIDFSAEDLSLAQGIAHQAAVVLAQATAYANEVRRRQEAEFLLTMAESLSGTLELEAILSRALHGLPEYLKGIQSAEITILENDGRILRLKSSWYEKPEYNLLSLEQIAEVEETIFSRQALMTRDTVVVYDLGHASNLNERVLGFVEQGLRSLLYIPLMINDRPLGLLHIYAWHTPRSFTEEEIILCRSVANQAAVAINNANLYLGQKRQLKLAQMLQKVGALLTTSLTLPEVYGQLFDYLAEIVEYDYVTLYLEDLYTSAIIPAAGRGGEADNLAHGHEGAEYAENWLRRIPLPPGWAVIGDTFRDTGWLQFPKHGEVRSWVGAILLVKDQLIGILSVESKVPQKYNTLTGKTVAAFANQAAIAIANARLHDQVLQQADELAILHQISIATAVTLEVDELLSKTTEMITNILYPEVFGFVLVNPVTDRLWRHPSHTGLPAGKQETTIVDEAALDRVVKTKEPLIIEDISQDPMFKGAFPAEIAHSIIMVPLTIDETVVAVIEVASAQVSAFSEKDLFFLITLAGKVAVAIERARLYERLLAQTDSLAQQVNVRTSELQAAQDRTSAILEGAGEGIVLTDSEANIMYVNPAMERMSGYSREELIGKPLRIFISQGTSHEMIFQEFWQEISNSERWSGELLNERKDGSTYTVSLTTTPIADNNGQIQGFVCVELNISRLKEVDQLKAEFITNVTHELRTPLTNIKTYVSLLKRGRPENQERYYQVLHGEIDRLDQMIQDLLDVSRLDAEFVPLLEATTNVIQLIGEVREYFSARIDEKELTVTEEWHPPHLPLVAMGGAHLRKILRYLFDNAIKYSLDGGLIEVTGNIKQRAEHFYLHFQLADNGLGLIQKDREQLFERFYRGEAARRLNVAGTGLGLAVSKKIIEGYGGLIEGEANPYGGALFTLWIPLIEEPVSQ